MSKSGIFCMERGDEKEDGLMPLHFSKFDSLHGGGLGGPLGRGVGGWQISEGGGSECRKGRGGIGYKKALSGRQKRFVLEPFSL